MTRIGPISGTGGGLTESEADALYVKLVGDTMSGTLTFDGTTLPAINTSGDDIELGPGTVNFDPALIGGPTTELAIRIADSIGSGAAGEVRLGRQAFGAPLDGYLMLTGEGVAGQAQLSVGDYDGDLGAFFSQNANPTLDATRDLGISSKRWRHLLLSGNLDDGTNSLTVANAKTAYDHSQDNTQAHTDYLLNNADDTGTGQIAFDRTYAAGDQLAVLDVTSSSFAYGDMMNPTRLTGLKIDFDETNESAASAFGWVSGIDIDISMDVASGTRGGAPEGLGVDVSATMHEDETTEWSAIYGISIIGDQTTDSSATTNAIKGVINGKNSATNIQSGMNAARFDAVNSTTGTGWAKGFSGFAQLSASGTGRAIGVAGSSNTTSGYSIGFQTSIAGGGTTKRYAFLEGTGSIAMSRFSQVYISSTELVGDSNPASNLTVGTTGGNDLYVEDDLEVDGTIFCDGNLILPVKTTTGDPGSPVEGQVYVNTSDNKARVYADSAWRDLATW